MNILEQIFKVENPNLQNRIPEETFDLLFEWFNESAVNVEDFERDFFNPLLDVYRQQQYEKYLFENYFEQTRRIYYIKFAFIYLIGIYPKAEKLKRLFQFGFRSVLIQNITGWNCDASSIIQYPELFKKLIVGADISRYYYAINLSIEVNINYVSGSFERLKFQDDKEVFTVIFNYVNQQVFEAKPYLMFLLFKFIDHKVKHELDDNGKYDPKIIATFLTTPYDKKIDAAFESSIDEFNQIFDGNLSRQYFLYIKEFMAYKEVGKKIKLTLDNFEEARTLIKNTEGQECIMLDHIIYYLQQERLYEQQRYWEILVSGLCTSCISNPDWLQCQIDLLLGKPNTHNAQLIFELIITPLLKNISSQLQYQDTVVAKYEKLLFQRTEILPLNAGLLLLRDLAKTINNRPEKNFVLSRLGSFYININDEGHCNLSHDHNDKKFAIIKNFIDDLNLLVPVALKSVIRNKGFYHDEKLLTLNYRDNDFVVSKFTFIKDINTLLTQNNSPYRLTAIPLTLKHDERIEFTFCSMAYMNESEHKYFFDHYLTQRHKVERWYPNRLYGEEKILASIEESEAFNPVFKATTTVYFADLKFSNQDNQKLTHFSNTFSNDLNWQWFKNKYIDELNSKEQWYEIMEVIRQYPKGKKPNNKWLEDLKISVEKLGTEKYFKELQVLVSQSLKEESWFFDDYAKAFTGLIWSCAYINPTDISLGILKTIAEFSYTKVPNGPKSAATGNLALEALIATQKDEAFGMLNIMRNKTKYNRFVVALEKSIDEFKENSSIPEQLLADQSIPGFGFKNGERAFIVSDCKLFVQFKNGKILKQWFDNNDLAIKQIPPQIAKDFARDLKEVIEEVRQISGIFTDLKKRIKTYWLYDRVWQFADWEKYIRNHNLIYPHIEKLVWTNKTKNTDFIVLNHQLLNVDNNLEVPEATDEIKLWHPVLNNESNILQWQNYIWDNNILQPERQVYREHYPFSETELELNETPRFAHHFLEVKKLTAIANNAGWIFTYVHEGVSWPRVYLKPLNITAHITCDYDRYSYAIPTKYLYFTNGNSTKINDYKNSSVEKVKLSTLPPVTISEVCRDIDLFIAITSIGNNIELSENRQDFETYRTDYQKGLFSDNANGKIRKQIIEKLIPVLRLNVEKFERNYILIKGKAESYRINLNSGFAQISDTQMHINILPNMNEVKRNKKIRLPIEDDETLYIILAKILYLQKL